MKRFENAHVGDEVYCRLYGNGIIKSIDYSECELRITCLFEKHHNRYAGYDVDGKHNCYCEEPMLFYRKGSEKYLTERPEPEIDWSKVPMGTKVVTADQPIINNNNYYIEFFMGYFHELDDQFWTFNDMHRDSAAGYKYCKLAEPIKPEWIKRD